jgi:hypothetical protein
MSSDAGNPAAGSAYRAFKERNKLWNDGVLVAQACRKGVIFSQMYDLVYEQMDQAGVEEIWKSRSWNLDGEIVSSEAESFGEG